MLPRSQRLVAVADHRLVARRGSRSRRGPLTVRCVLTTPVAQPARLAVVVPKAVGSAPVRNRLRRRLLNLVAPAMAGLPEGALIVVRAEQDAGALTFRALGAVLETALVGATRGGTRQHP